MARCFVAIRSAPPASPVGEVVFNTAMTGYQEILTDPSYCRQIVTLTYPHIGNTGVNPEDVESDRVYAAGLVIRDLPLLASNWRQTEDLSAYLRAQNVVAIAGIDTRKLTRILREKGAQSGCLMAARCDRGARRWRRRARFPGLAGMDLAKVVSCDEALQLERIGVGAWPGYGRQDEPAYHVVAYDYGIKRNILRKLAVARLQADGAAGAGDARRKRWRCKPDGVFLSNGPGDPEPCDYAIRAIRELLDVGVPIFGICLGHQLLGLACGARTREDEVRPSRRQPPGAGPRHRARDDHQPEPRLRGGRGDAAGNCRVTHRSLFDGTLQGFARTDRPAFCFQGHPEASPGPHDVDYLFDRFIGLMAEAAPVKQ